MNWKTFFSSSIGQKFIMAMTGTFLILFLIVHAGINSCIFLNDHGATFNQVAHFMSHNWIMRFMELGLFAGLILHIIKGLSLWSQNKKARPVGYHFDKPSASSNWYSRSMGLLGTLLLLFLVMHLAHFFVGTKAALYSGDRPHDLFEEMKVVFAEPVWVWLYVGGIVALFWHLYHGFQSAFQTFGLHNKKYSALIKTLGLGYSIIVCVLFALMPLAMHFGWII
jgi:succinate dehydrogenase / fumarate reductase cytochrome b subunit